MKRIIAIVLFNFLLVSYSHAAIWTKLQDNKHAELMLDKQSITSSKKYQKAWVKIIYKTMQTNLQYPEKQYNNAKMLWYFNCEEQKSATAQVYQLLNEEQVFSAAIDVERARFIEPVPETEIDIAMHYVCKQMAYRAAAKEKAEAAKAAQENVQKPTVKEENVAEKPAVVPEVKDEKKEEVIEGETETKESKKSDDEHSDEQDKEEDKETKSKKHKVVHWKYKGSKGPEFWGDLSDEFISCKVGRNQSPIDISKTTITTPKPLKAFQRFPVTEIFNNGHTVQANFKSGNIMVVDSVMYQMKQVHFHAPSENKILGQSFPLEAHFVHADTNGHLAVLAVMYEEGADNPALAKLWKQMPKTKGKPKPLKSKVLAGELIPRKKEYYRFSGSLTTPPCTEGVIWIVMKSTMTASKSQIEAFQKVMRHDNNRPVQPLNGRIIIE